MRQINFAVIQSGYAVFGVGETREQAIADAANWLEDENGRQGGLTEEQVEELIQVRPNNGHFTILRRGYDDEELDSYLENHGGYVKHDDGIWYDEDAE
jgi:ribosomal protein S13